MTKLSTQRVFSALRPIALNQGLYVGGERQVNGGGLFYELLFELFGDAQGQGDHWLRWHADWTSGVPLHHASEFTAI